MTSPDVPRRRAKTDEERLRNSLQASGARTADGGTTDARAVQRGGRAIPWQPPPIPPGGTTGEVLTKFADDDYAMDWEAAPSGGGGPIGALEQADFSPPTSGFLDPSHFSDSVDDASAMSYVSATDPSNPSPGEPGILVDVGWYLVYAIIDVSTAVTDPIKLWITSPTGFGEPAAAYLPPGVTVSTELTAHTAFHLRLADAPGLIVVNIDNPGSSTIAFGRVTVVKLA